MNNDVLLDQLRLDYKFRNYQGVIDTARKLLVCTNKKATPKIDRATFWRNMKELQKRQRERKDEARRNTIKKP